MTPVWTVHEQWPADAAAVVDQGLEAANAAAAPLHEVRPMAVVVRNEAGVVIGGAMGRSWGARCELQQLWVAPAQRGQGLGRALVLRFEALARSRGASLLYLYTWSFQAPAFYARLGWRISHTLEGFPHGLVMHLMERELASGPIG